MLFFFWKMDQLALHLLFEEIITQWNEGISPTGPSQFFLISCLNYLELSSAGRETSIYLKETPYVSKLMFIYKWYPFWSGEIFTSGQPTILEAQEERPSDVFYFVFFLVNHFLSKKKKKKFTSVCFSFKIHEGQPVGTAPCVSKTTLLQLIRSRRMFLTFYKPFVLLNFASFSNLPLNHDIVTLQLVCPAITDIAHVVNIALNLQNGVWN